MTMPVEVLRKIEAAIELEAEKAEQAEGHSARRPGPGPVTGAAPGLYAKIAKWFGIRRDDVETQSIRSPERPSDER